MNLLIYSFPTLVITSSTIAGIIFIFVGKYGTGIYWLAAAAINYAATFLIPKLG